MHRRSIVALLAAIVLLLAAARAGAAASDFTVAVVPSSATVAAGSSVAARVITAGLGGFSGDVQLTASNLPPDATALFSPAQITVDNATFLTVSTASSTPPGSYKVTVTATQVVVASKLPPLVRTVVLPITVKASKVSVPLSLLYFFSYKKHIRGSWKQQLPTACPTAGEPCTLIYKNLAINPRLWYLVLTSNAEAPNLSFETFHFSLPSLSCNVDGDQVLTGLVGIADGPYPGTVEFIDSKIVAPARPSFLPFLRDFYAFYTIHSPYLTSPSTSTGLIMGAFIGGGCSQNGVTTGAYDADFESFDHTVLDSGTITGALVRTSAETTLDLTLNSSNLPADAALPPPTPVCPPAGCL